jgi:phospholipid/cholesterol/gamma-HCH transport system ATP-binding protein
MTDAPIIQVQHLIAQYGNQVILQDVSFTVQRGEVFVIVGGSGCGKSTLLRHMVGLEKAHGGRVLIDGIDIHQCSDADFQQTLQKIGVLFQGAALFGSMTLSENVGLPIAEYARLSKTAIEHLVRMKLCAVELDGYELHLPSEISGGMKKRAGLARALALNPDIVFLDEPTAGLDPITAADIDRLILKINQSLGTTIVIVTHDLDSIMMIGQRAIMLDKQTRGIVAEGDPRTLRDRAADPAVRAFFQRRGLSPSSPSELPADAGGPAR